MRHQASYFLPLGAGALVDVVNRRAGLIFVSSMLGPEALAFYVTGAFAAKLVNVFRGAVADVIFPEIVGLKYAVAKDALPLWKRATVWYCVILFPMTMLFFVYADAIVTVLFTAEYGPSITIFAVYALMMVIACFDFHLPLRVQNANRYYVIGSLVTLVSNIALLYPLYIVFGLLGPVIALIIARLLFTVYLSVQVVKIYHIGFADLVYWKDVWWVSFATVVCGPILVIGKFAVDHLLLRGVLFGGAYMVAYLLLLRYLGVWDIWLLVNRIMRRRRRASHGLP